MLSTILFIYCKHTWFHTCEYMPVISNSRMLQSLHMSHNCHTKKWHHSCNYLEQLQQSGSFHASRNVTHEWWTEGVLVPSAAGTWNAHKKYLCWNPSISSNGILTDGYKCGTQNMIVCSPVTAEKFQVSIYFILLTAMCIGYIHHFLYLVFSSSI